MSARLARTADGWWVVTPRPGWSGWTCPPRTAALLTDRTALTAAIEAARPPRRVARCPRSRWTCSAR